LSYFVLLFMVADRCRRSKGSAWGPTRRGRRGYIPVVLLAASDCAEPQCGELLPRFRVKTHWWRLQNSNRPNCYCSGKPIG